MPGKEYIYRVRSKNAAGDAFSSEIPFLVPGTYVAPVSYIPKPFALVPKAVAAPVAVTPQAQSGSGSVTPPSPAPKSTLSSFVSGVTNLFKNPFKK